MTHTNEFVTELVWFLNNSDAKAPQSFAGVKMTLTAINQTTEELVNAGIIDQAVSPESGEYRYYVTSYGRRNH